jgi:hypothetical protein
MERDVWKKISFDYPRAVPTMLADEEKRYLYWLGKTAWDGKGLILEIGPWLGGSTVCLAAGMHASNHDARSKLHTVDNFLWRDFMSARAPLPLRAGESFEPYFLRNVAACADTVVAHAAALPDETVDAGAPLLFDGLPGNDPISILFIDGAKSWRGMRHLLRVCANRLLPGTSLLVCQDFKFWSACWVPMMMARLADVVRPVHNVLGGTTVAFRLERPIPPSVLDALEDGLNAIEAEQGLRLLNRAREWLAKDGDALGAAHVALARVRFLSHLGMSDEATREFVKIQSGWPSRHDVSQLVMASAFLRRSSGRSIPRPISISLSWQRQKLKGAWRKRVPRR